jgi:hypothetical protein
MHVTAFTPFALAFEPCAKDQDSGCSVRYCELSEVTGAGRSSSFSVPISVVASHRRHDQRVLTAATLSQELYKTDGEERGRILIFINTDSCLSCLCSTALIALRQNKTQSSLTNKQPNHAPLQHHAELYDLPRNGVPQYQFGIIVC